MAPRCGVEVAEVMLGKKGGVPSLEQWVASERKVGEGEADGNTADGEVKDAAGRTSSTDIR